MQVLGLVTIGQSPRTDVVESMFGERAPVSFIEDGALNDLNRQQIDDLRPNLNEMPFVTRLRDGSEVVVAKKRLMPHMNRAVSRLEAAGCTTICVLCTGEFPPLGTSSLVIYPDRIVRNVVDAILPDGVLGVLMPHAGQAESMRSKWTTKTRSAITGVASPYSAAGHVAQEVERLEAAGARSIVLDCMGFDRQMLADARRNTTKPVILSNGIVGSVLVEIVGASARVFDHAQ